MKIAVITPYYRARRDWLAQCHESVQAQTCPCVHFLVADGTPEEYVERWNVQHIVLRNNQGDYGDTPRAVGSISAIGQRFDALTYLDADNWYAPDHIESLIDLHRATGAPVCTTSRNFHRIDGSFLGPCPFSDGETFVDTSSLWLAGDALRLGLEWAFIPHELALLADRVMWHNVKASGLPTAHTGRPTMAYRTAYVGDYLMFNEKAPPGADKSGAELVAAREAARQRGLHELAIPIRQLRSQAGRPS